MDSVLTGEFRGLLPVRNYLLFPLPIEHLAVFSRPAIGYPIRHRIGGTAARAAGETNDHAHAKAFGQQHCSPECLCITLRNLGIGMHRVTMATERRHLDIAILKFLLPSASFAGVVEQILHRTVS